jgi:hypothetical protein
MTAQLERRVMRATHVALALAALACGHHLPSPPLVAAPIEGPPLRGAPFEAVDVPSPPPAAHVEYVPLQPRDEAVWIDGQWTYEGRWRWDPGGWLLAPNGASFAPWRVLRLRDGGLVLVPASWRDARGSAMEPPPFLVRATPANHP